MSSDKTELTPEQRIKFDHLLQLGILSDLQHRGLINNDEYFKAEKILKQQLHDNMLNLKNS